MFTIFGCSWGLAAVIGVLLSIMWSHNYGKSSAVMKLETAAAAAAVVVACASDSNNNESEDIVSHHSVSHRGGQ